LIEGIIADQKDAVRQVVRAGLEAGRGPRDVALDIVGRINRATGRREGGILGLTSGQTDAVIRARSELANLDAGYFRRVRRDARFDGLVRRAIRDDKPLSSADINKITGRYSDRLLQLRGETIARTEGITALGAGQFEGFQQLVDSGQVREDQIERTWQATGDARTRIDHLAMNKQQVKGLHEPFIAPDGSRLLYPRDISHGASASETINCRCYMKIRVRYI
jgi:hypothetical protein